MKQKSFFNPQPRLWALLVGIFFMCSALRAQTYCYQFVDRVVGSNVEVDVYITPSKSFRLGSAKILFSYNAAALSLINPITYTNLLPAIYTVDAKKESNGIVEIDITYNGVTLGGTNVPISQPSPVIPAGLKIGTVTFGILNPTIVRDFKLVRKPNKKSFLYKDDNDKPLASSSQCPPSPYTSLFYDVNVELDATIPMDQCVDSKNA